MDKKIENIKPEKKSEEEDDIDITSGLKKVKGAFDALPGGAKLKSLSIADKDPNYRTFDSLKLERDRLQKEFDEIPKPKGDPKIKRRRYYINKKIKDIEKKMSEIKKFKINKDPIDFDEVEKYENLSQQIGYKHTPLGLMDRVQFELEKKNILDKADKIFNEQAEIISQYIIMMSHCTDSWQSVSGFSLDLTKGKDRLTLQVKKCLIHEGMKGNQFADAFSNPYIGMCMALGMPLFARYSYNKANPPQLMEGEKKNTQNNGKMDNRRQSTIKVEMGKQNLQPHVVLGTTNN